MIGPIPARSNGFAPYKMVPYTYYPQFKSAKGKYIAPVPIEAKLSANRMLEQICVMGSVLPAPVAMVVLSETARKLPKEEVESSIKTTLVDVNKQLESHERLGRVIIAAGDWTTQNGMLTPTLKSKRDVLEKHYRSLLDAQHLAFVVWE